MSGAQGVLALLLVQWAAGWVGAAAWTQSWSVVRRGHFRIVAWCVLAVAGMGVVANGAATEDLAQNVGPQQTLVLALLGASGLYLAAQYVRGDMVGAVVGALAAAAGVGALALSAALLGGWPPVLAFALFVTGAAVLGAVTNGMLLGHWYLNQPGLKPWALARLTLLCLAAVVACGIVGVVSAGRLLDASFDGAVLGVPGFGDSAGTMFFGVWLAILGLTGLVVWGARRCIKIRSIQSATGLYYVALLTAGVAQFLLLYLMVAAA